MSIGRAERTVQLAWFYIGLTATTVAETGVQKHSQCYLSERHSSSASVVLHWSGSDYGGGAENYVSERQQILTVTPGNVRKNGSV